MFEQNWRFLKEKGKEEENRKRKEREVGTEVEVTKEERQKESKLEEREVWKEGKVSQEGREKKKERRWFQKVDQFRMRKCREWRKHYESWWITGANSDDADDDRQGSEGSGGWGSEVFVKEVVVYELEDAGNLS